MGLSCHGWRHAGGTYVHKCAVVVAVPIPVSVPVPAATTTTSHTWRSSACAFLVWFHVASMRSARLATSSKVRGLCTSTFSLITSRRFRTKLSSFSSSVMPGIDLEEDLSRPLDVPTGSTPPAWCRPVGLGLPCPCSLGELLDELLLESFPRGYTLSLLCGIAALVTVLIQVCAGPLRQVAA